MGKTIKNDKTLGAVHTHTHTHTHTHGSLINNTRVAVCYSPCNAKNRLLFNVLNIW